LLTHLRTYILTHLKIRKGDNVIMLSGKDKGKKGKILKVLGERVVVDGLNLVKRHLRARKQGQKGQIVSKERLVSASSVGLICKSCGKITRVGYKVDGKNKTRICKKCGADN
jgi:large subunit ribosomal protein L24